MPDAIVSHGYTRSTGVDRFTWYSTDASASTLAVCMAETMTPRSTASTGRPRVPTRYAAMTVLPCPGASACPAPNSSARPIMPSSASGVTRRVTRFEKPLSARTTELVAEVSDAGAASTAPGENVNDAVRRSRGAWRRSPG